MSDVLRQMLKTWRAAALLCLMVVSVFCCGVAYARSGIDLPHVIGADFNRRTGLPTGGHTLLNGDVRIIAGSESPPDSTGVYRAHVEMADPDRPGRWVVKTDRNGKPMWNTMFPKAWAAERVAAELDAAWNSPHKTVRGDKWSALTPSGVRVEGFTAPRVTAYPVYSK